MRRQLQIKNGIAQGEWQGSGGMPVPPDDTYIFLDVTDRPEAQVGMTYDAASDTFSAAPVVPRTIVSKAQVVGVLTAQEWSEMNKYHPTAAAPYNDAEIFHAISQFQLAQTINLSDPAYTAIMTSLVTKGLLSATRAEEIYESLVAVANQ